jgi:hypothetical protein
MEPLNHQNRSRAQAEADFVPHLKRGSQLSLEKQFVRAVREAIGCGRLRPGMRLPSSQHAGSARARILSERRVFCAASSPDVSAVRRKTGSGGAGALAGASRSLSARTGSWTACVCGV